MRRRIERHNRYLIPYLAIFLVTWAMLGLSRPSNPVELWIALALQIFVGGLVWTWTNGRASTTRFMTGTVALAVSVGLQRDAIALNPGVSSLLLLPAVLAALRASRRELIFSVLAAALTLYVPVIVVGGTQYPVTSLRGATLLLMLDVVIGATVLVLVTQLSEGQERQRRLTEEARSQLTTEDALRRVATLVAAGAPADELFSEVSLQLARIAGASMGAVIRFDAELAIGEIVGGWRADRSVLRDRRVDLHGPSAAAVVARTHKPVTLTGSAPETGVEEATAAVAAPIVVSGRLWGAASAVFTEGEAIPAGIQARFERFCELVAMAIANAEAVSQLVEHASIDALTGIPNRRSFDKQLSREIERASRNGRPLSLALLDIDRFKTVNDTYGHAVGDRVLTEVAQLLMSQARAGDLVARLGGEEFVWVMPDTTVEQAVVATERARRAVGEVAFEGGVGHITLSAGVAANLHASTRAALLGGADEALYMAKSAGRDQTVAAPASLSVAEERVNPAAA